jgi:serine protease DegQ
MRRSALAAIAVLAALATGCSGGDGDDEAAGTTAAETTTVTVQSGGASAGGDVFGRIPQIVDRVENSVVAIDVQGGEGSGVIWDDQGTVVTNFHVVEGSDQAEVVLASGERLGANVVATDARTDLAVLRVQRDGLPAARFARRLPVVGELAIAVGNPAGFESTVTAGIISGLHRAIPSQGTTPALVDLIQTDAAISPGNSGGALVDANGEVIGINVAYIPPQQGSVSLGFAIPSPTAVDVVRELIESGEVRHAFLGVTPAVVTADLAQLFGLPVNEGLAVQSLEPNGPAARAGVREGDVIVRFGGQRLDAVEDLFGELRRRDPGEKVNLVVVRGEDDRRTVVVTLGERPD